MPEQTSTDLFQLWSAFTRLVRRRLWTILTFFTITVLVVATGTWMQTPVYRASVTVLIEREAPNVLSVSTLRDDSTIDRGSYQTYDQYYRTQLEIITSGGIAHKVFQRLNLGEMEVYATAKDPVGMLLSQVKVEPVKQTRLAKIHAEDTDPRQAARIANEFAVVFAEENLANSTAAEAINLMKNEYLQLQSGETELSKRYKPKHPTMVRLRKEMDELSSSIEQEMQRQLKSERIVAESGTRPEEDLPKSLLERLKERSMMGSLRPNNIRIQSLAKAPSRPAKPKKPLNLILGMLLGLIGGLGVAVAQELLDNSLKVPEDVEDDERFVLLGHVPQIDGVLAKARANSHKREQCIQLEPHSRPAEAYRALRTSLLYAIPEGNSHAIVVTSPGTEEGKTTTTTNLGIAMAQTGLRVLLVDADLRKGRLHRVFALKRRPGLSEFLVGQASFKEIVQPSRVNGLSVIAGGSFPPNPAELLDSSKMREFLKEAAAAFDRVLIDSAPMIAVTDAVILAAMTKTVLAVAQSGKTPRQALHRLNGLCRDVRAKVLGVVLNNVPERDAPAYYRYAAYRYTSATHESESGNGK